MKKKAKLVCGIDPGKAGAIVLLKRGKVFRKFTFPELGKDIDFYAVDRFLKKWAHRIDVVWMEQVNSMPGQSAPAMFKFGMNYGAMIGILASNNLSYNTVRPQAWQKFMFRGVSAITKVGARTGSGSSEKVVVRNNKAMAAVAAKRRWPTVDFRKNERCKVAHDGIVDAALIAYYGYKYG